MQEETMMMVMMETSNVEQAGFDCIAITANDVEIEPPEEESATLSVCKTEGSPNFEPDDFTFTVTGNGPPSPAQFLGNPNSVDVTISPGEYTVTEAAAFTNFGSEITGDCVDEDPASVVSRTATGEIQAGETQECRIFQFSGLEQFKIELGYW
jgi:hypothetical protein